MTTIHAIYEDGVFKPTQPVELPNATEVTFEPRPVVTPLQEQLNREEWVRQWRAWAASQPKRDLTMDDSRESIYGDDGR